MSVSTHPTSAALARRAGLGDGDAFAELFDRYFHPTFRHALHMLDGDSHLAQDATQTAWMKAWQKLPDFRGDSQFQTWVFSIVSRQVLEERRRRRPVLVDAALLEPLPARPHDAEPEVVSAREELWEALTLALAELPWRQRAVWLLREYESMSYAEIARVLDTNPAVVRGQLHRARATLSIRMEQWR